MYKFFISLLCFNIAVLAAQIDIEKINQTKGLVVTGYGLDKKMAINNGLKNSLEQFISLLVAQENIANNNDKIKKHFLLTPQKFIDSTSILNSSNENNLTSIKLNVNIKSQLIFNMLNHLKIPLISNVKSNYSILNINPNKTTKQIIDELNKLYDHFFSKENLKNIIKSKIINYDIKSNKIIQNRYLPIEISYKLEIDNIEYNKFISNLNETLLQIDNLELLKIDSPFYSHGDLKVLNKEKMLKVIRKNSFGIINYKNNVSSLDIYTLPIEYSNIKFINSCDKFNINSLLGLDILVYDKLTNNKISQYTIEDKFNYLLASNIYKNDIYKDGFSNNQTTINVIKPLFDTETNVIKYKYTIYIDKLLSNNSLSLKMLTYTK